MEKKRLYRNSKEGMLAGVLAGFSDYSGGDVTLWRLGFIALLIVTGLAPFAIMYVAAWIIIPERPENNIEPMPKDSYVVSE